MFHRDDPVDLNDPGDVELVPLHIEPQGIIDIGLFPHHTFPIGNDICFTENECVICLEEFHEGDTLLVLPDCRHIYHSKCISLWFTSACHCPRCRCDYTSYRDILDSSIADEYKI